MGRTTTALRGRTAVIIGAGGGIGRAVAQNLDRLGIGLALADRDSAALDQTAASLSGRPLLLSSDITDRDQIAALMSATVERFHKIDILVNAAGIIRPEWFDRAPHDDIDAQVAVNLTGPLHCTRAALEHMGPGGRIVTIASLAGAAPETKSAVYTATKYGLRGFGLTLGVELRRRRIRVTTIFPDGVDTPMLAYEAAHGGSPLTFLSEPVPPEKVADAVCRALHGNAREIFVPAGGALTARLVGLCPGIVPLLWPLLERLGEHRRHHFTPRRNTC